MTAHWKWASMSARVLCSVDVIVVTDPCVYRFVVRVHITL